MKKLLSVIGIGVGIVLLKMLSESKLFYSSYTDDELAEEHERERLKWCKGIDVYSTLRAIDNEMSKRANEKYDRDNPNAKPRPPREHGWYLPNDD